MLKSLNIAIVDDDEIYRYVILRTMQTSDISIKNLVFTNGEQALHFIVDNLGNQSELPDVILLDMNMPVMDGFEFMTSYSSLVPKISKKIIVIMISSSINPSDIQRAKSIQGISNYMAKPILPSKLIRTIAELQLENSRYSFTRSSTFFEK